MSNRVPTRTPRPTSVEEEPPVMTATATRPQARSTRDGRALTTYLVVVAGLVIPANLLAGALGANAHATDEAPVAAQIALYLQAVIPALAALAAWGVIKRRPEWGFRRTPRSTLATAWLIGVLAVAAGSVTAWVTGLAPFTSHGLSDAWGGLPPWLAALAGVLVGVLPWMVLAIGEELGWNSFLTPMLAKRWSRDRTALVVGVLWAAFHVPLMIFVPGAVPNGVPALWTVAWFAVECIALAYPLVWTRLRTGSIWPALVLHGTLNAALYLVTGPATRTTDSSGWFVGEGGLITSIGTVLAVVATAPLWRKRA